MSENLGEFEDDQQEAEARKAENVADLQGFLLKVATGGITVQDYVKRLNEDDILVAIDGKAYLDGPQRLRSTFTQELNQERKWLLTFYRNGVLFDILIEHPIQSAFGYSTQQETDLILGAFSKHAFGDFQSYQNFEVYRDKSGKCDVLSFEEDAMSWLLPPLWLLKYRLYPPLAAVGILYLLAYVINIYFFIATAVVIAIYIKRAQNNLLRSFTMFDDKYHYMTVAATNENDVNIIVKRIEPRNTIRFEKNVIKKRVEIRKTIAKAIEDPEDKSGFS